MMPGIPAVTLGDRWVEAGLKMTDYHNSVQKSMSVLKDVTCLYFLQNQRNLYRG